MDDLCRIYLRHHSQLADWNKGETLGIACSHVGFNLPDGSMLSPTAAWIERSVWQGLTKYQRQRYPPLAPYFLIEVVTNSRMLSDLQAKMKQWIANGTRLAWLIDPDQQTATIYRPGQPTEHLHDPAIIFGEGLLEGLELNLEGLWLETINAKL